MKIAIIGAGALGGYVGASLADGGVDVILYDVREDYVKRVKQEGLFISRAGTPDEKNYKPPITNQKSDLEGCDVWILATKAYQTGVAIEGIKDMVKDDHLVGSFQNGYGNIPVIEEAVGNLERVLAITTAHNFRVTDEIHIAYFMGVGGVDIGPMAGQKTGKIEELAQAMKALKVPVKTHDSGEEVIWNKILWNAVLNCTAAITGMDVIAMANIEHIKPVFDGLAGEYFALMEKMGIPAWNGPDFIDKIMMGAKMAAKIPTFAPPKPSMLQDMEAKRPTEVDYINGALVKKGEELGVPTPVNKTMWYLVKTMEANNLAAKEKE